MLKRIVLVTFLQISIEDFWSELKLLYFAKFSQLQEGFKASKLVRKIEKLPLLLFLCVVLLNSGISTQNLENH